MLAHHHSSAKKYIKSIYLHPKSDHVHAYVESFASLNESTEKSSTTAAKKKKKKKQQQQLISINRRR